VRAGSDFGSGLHEEGVGLSFRLELPMPALVSAIAVIALPNGFAAWEGSPSD
jgi:hypothetical protein